MNTPVHLVVNLAALGGGDRRLHTRWIAAGALLPDLPMFGFFVWERFVLETPMRRIWDHAYFEPGWQGLFDLFNSIPLALVGLALFAGFRRTGPALLFASALLHQLLDLPVHREDGHRHFVPFSDWRFMSPVSYWDPDHGGAFAALAEIALLAACSVVVARRNPSRAWRAALAALVTLSAAGWLAFYAPIAFG